MKLLLKNCFILDGTLNMEVKENYQILIEDEIIKKIDTEINEKADKIIDLKNAYVLPGLINMHVHLPASGKITKKKAADQKKLIKFICSNPLTRKIGVNIGAKYAKMELLSGVTTLRAVGGIDNFDSTLASLINKNKKIGPRILAANVAIGVKNGHMDGTVAKGCDTIDEAVKMVENAKAINASLVKLMITGGVLDCKERGTVGVLKMPSSMVKACCDKAHELGFKVAAHVEGSKGMEVAINNGVDTIEHGADVSDELLKKFKERNGALICTLSPAMPLAKIDYNKLGYDELAQYNTKVLLKGMINVVNKCLKENILVGLGTDTGCPLVTHYDMYRELIYFSKYIDGVTNSFAIHTATEVNAKILDIDNITGTIKENKVADMMIVKDNPLIDLKALKDPLFVIARGKVYTKHNKKYNDVEKELNSIL